ncbi:MAG: hypothetical protein Tsb0032_24650 [Kiloniellaceae bacterium]
MSAAAEADRIPEPPLRDLYVYWHGKRAARRWPASREMVAGEMTPLLPFAFTVEVLSEGRHFRFLELGSDVAIGVDPTGRLQHEALPEGIYRDHITALFRRGAAGPGALYSRSSYDYTQTEGPRSVSRLFLPLAADGETVDRMLIGQTSDREDCPKSSTWLANPPTVTEEVEFRLP